MAFLIGAIVVTAAALYFVRIGKDKQRLKEADKFKKGVYAKDKKKQELKGVKQHRVV